MLSTRTALVSREDGGEDGDCGNHCVQVGPDSDNGDIAQDGGHQHHGDEGSVRYYIAITTTTCLCTNLHTVMLS